MDSPRASRHVGRMKFYWTHIFRAFFYRQQPPPERRMTEIRLALAVTLRKRRRAAGLTQAHLAARIGSSQPTISRLERASRRVSLDHFVRAMIALNATSAEISAAFNVDEDRGVQLLRSRTFGWRRT